MPQTIAILPARGGSKRIPRKNIRDFAGKPAIGWPLCAALDADLFDRVIVSTDDTEIADTARSLGAEIPYLRRPELSDDHTGTTDVIRDVMQRLEIAPDASVCCIYATAVFVSAADLAHGYDLLQGGADWVMAVAEYASPIDRAYRRDGDRLMPCDREKMSTRTQDLAPAYYDAGQFYWAKSATWLDPDARVWDGAAAVEIPAERAIDIDTEQDWMRAEMAFEFLRKTV